MTQFYFELYHTFRRVLEKSSQQAYETDFENYIFEWNGEFPEEDVIARYNEKICEVNTVGELLGNSVSPKQDLPERTAGDGATTKNKVELFLEAANAFTFSDMPKVKELGTLEKIRQLVECMLNEKDTIADTFGHTAAMLEYLGFFKWIGERHVSGYRLNQFDKWCTQNIMNKSAGDSFRHYRLSVLVNPTDIDNASYKYLGWKYKSVVEEEYKKILEG